MNNSHSYGGLAIVLHWMSALLILAVLLLGWKMGDMSKGPDKLLVMGWHQTVGICVMTLAVLRLVWRKAHTVPSMSMATRTDKLAAWVQIVLYLLMLVIPVMGYLTTSFGGHSLVLFGSVHVPLLTAINLDVHESLSDAHQALAYVMLALIALHAAGALKHHFILRDDVLTRMLPMMKPRKD